MTRQQIKNSVKKNRKTIFGVIGYTSLFLLIVLFGAAGFYW